MLKCTSEKHSFGVATSGFEVDLKTVGRSKKTCWKEVKTGVVYCKNCYATKDEIISSLSISTDEDEEDEE